MDTDLAHLADDLTSHVSDDVAPALPALARLIQPSAAVAGGPLGGWASAVAAQAGSRPSQAALAGLVAEAAAQDGPVARARALALGTVVVRRSVASASPEQAAATACRTTWLLELSARAHRRDVAGDLAHALPARMLFARYAAGSGGFVVPRRTGSHPVLLEAIRALADAPVPTVLDVDDDDPLNLDAILCAGTGVRPDGGYLDVCLAAEHLRAVARQGRARFAGVALAMAETTAAFGVPPIRALMDALAALDGRIEAVHAETSAVADDAFVRCMSPTSLRERLHPVAASIARAFEATADELAAIACGLLPETSDGAAPTGSRPTGSRPTGSRPTGSRPTGSRPTAGSRPGSEPADADDRWLARARDAVRAEALLDEGRHDEALAVAERALLAAQADQDGVGIAYALVVGGEALVRAGRRAVAAQVARLGREELAKLGAEAGLLAFDGWSVAVR